MATVVGIDIGSGVTRLAQTTPARKMPVILRNSLSNEATPTLVSYPDEGMRLYGEAALGKELSRPHQTATVLKQSLSAEPENMAGLASLTRTGCKLAVGDDGKHVVYEINGKQYTPCQLLAFYLRQVLTFATEENPHVCLAAPVAATARFRARLRDAARVAGVKSEVTIVDEADALVAYMHHLQFKDLPDEPTEATKVLILNVGESFTSVVAASLCKTEATVLAAAGRDVGTSVVDAALAQKAFDSIKAKLGEDVSTHAKSHNKVIRECKKAKVMLSTTDKVHVQFECLKGDFDHQMHFTTAELHDASEQLVTVLGDLVGKVMETAEMTKGCRVEVVGNGWRSPILTNALKAITGADRLGLSLDSNMCVAEGAACLGVVRNVAATGTSDKPTSPEEKDGENKKAASGSEPASPAADAVHTVQLRRSENAPTVADEPGEPSETIEEWTKLEEQLDEADEQHRKQLRALNEFESYLFQTREHVEPAFKDDTSGAGAKLRDHLEKEEMWLYDARDGLVEGFSTGMILERLESLKALVSEHFPQVGKYLEEETARRKAKDEELARLAKENEGEKELKSDPQRLRVAQERREQGANLFKQEHFQEAQTRFVQALGILGDLYDNTGDNKAKKEEISLSCHLNIASCCVKQGLWKIAVSNCTKALELKPDHPKALFRRGQAQSQLHEHEAAKGDLEKAAELTNNDAGVVAELDAVKQRIAAAKEKEKKLFSKMFA